MQNVNPDNSISGALRVMAHLIGCFRFLRWEGLSLVDPYLPAYVPDPQLVTFVQRQKDPFMKWHDSRLRPRGLMFKGIAGTGKTLGAKYIAREWGLSLFRIDATVQSKWHGETEGYMSLACARA